MQKLPQKRSVSAILSSVVLCISLNSAQTMQLNCQMSPLVFSLPIGHVSIDSYFDEAIPPPNIQSPISYNTLSEASVIEFICLNNFWGLSLKHQSNTFQIPLEVPSHPFVHLSSPLKGRNSRQNSIRVSCTSKSHILKLYFGELYCESKWACIRERWEKSITICGFEFHGPIVMWT